VGGFAASLAGRFAGLSRAEHEVDTKADLGNEGSEGKGAASPHRSRAVRGPFADFVR
jgi:hypothetical protein